MSCFKISAKIKQNRIYLIKIAIRFFGEDVVNEILDICTGIRLLRSLTKKYNHKNYLILISTFSLGDCLYALSCLDAYKQKNPSKKIAVIGKERNRQILELYSQIDELVLVSEEKDIDTYRKFMETKKLFRISKKNNVFQTDPYCWGREVCQEYDAIYLLQTYLFNLSQNDIITYPDVPLVPVNSIKDFQCNKDRIVVLNPYSYSMYIMNEDLFSRICTVLNQSGYIVYTNVVGDQDVVEGSFELRCSIIELYSIAMEIPYVISIRSGILDLLVNTNTKIIALYGECEDLIKTLYTLKGWKKGHVLEIFDTTDTDAVLSDVKEILEHDKENE